MLKSRIIIFGGQGFVGLNIIKTKAFQNIKIYLIGNRNKKINDYKFNKKKITLIESSIFDINSFKSINFNNAIVIFAASNTNESNFFINSQNLFNHLSKFKILKFFLLSSISVYGNNNSFINERTKINPLSTYANNCLSLEKLSKFFFQHSTSLYIFRITNIFGFPKKNPGVIEQIFLNNLKGFNFEFNKKKLLRSYIYIDTLISIINLFINKNITSGIYNISNPYYIFSLKDICEILKVNFKFNKKIKYNNYKISIINSKCLSKKISNIYKFENQFLEDLKKMEKNI